MKKTIIVYSNDPETPQLTLTLAGELWVDVAAQPNRLSFGEVRRADKASQQLSLTIAEPKKVAITSVTLDDKRFAVTPQPSDSEGQKNYLVSFGGASELGPIRAQVRVSYSHPDGEQHLDIPLWGQVVGDLRYPNRVFFGKQRNGFMPQKITVSSRSGSAVRIVSAIDPEGRLTAKILKAHGPRAELELSVTKPAVSAQGNLILKTSDREEPTVTVPYTLHTPPLPQLAAPAAKPLRSRTPTPRR